MRWRSLCCILLIVAVLPKSTVAGLDTQPSEQGKGETVVLAPALAEAMPSHQRRGVFYQQTAVVLIGLNQQIWLASAPDRAGVLCTDDQASITFRRDDGYSWTWSHSYTSTDKRSIICTAPHNLTDQVPPGRYHIEVILEDQHPPTYSTHPYYLILVPLVSAPQQPVGATMPPAPTVTSVPSPPARTPISERPQPLPTTTVVLTQPAQFPAIVAGVEAPPSSAARQRPVLLAVALLAAALLCGALYLRRRRAAQARMIGVLDLLDQATGEARTLLLASYPQGAAIVRHPLGLVQYPPDPTQATQVIGRITFNKQGICISEATPQLPSSQVFPLQSQRPHTLAEGQVVIRYRRY